MNNTLRFTQVSNRLINQKNDVSKVTLDKCNRTPNNNYGVFNLAKTISESTVDSNKYIINLLEMTKKVDITRNNANENIHNVIRYDILPKLTKEKLKEVKKWFSSFNEETNYFSKNDFLNQIEENLIIERVATNHKALSKRFNFNKIADKYISKKDYSTAVNEMCNLIDTYDISMEAKFNIALENILYVMNINGCKDSQIIVENVLDYFLNNNLIIPDKTYSKMQSLLKENKFIIDSIKESLNYFTEAKNDKYGSNINKLADKCKSEEARRMIKSINNIKSEKDASEYIKNCLQLCKNNNIDKSTLHISIFLIPLATKVSKPFVIYQYNFYKQRLNYIEYNNDISNKVDKFIRNEDNLIYEAYEEIDDSNDYKELNENALDFSYLLESDEYNGSDDIKDLLNKFKKEQKKSSGTFNYYLSKIYKKSPENIIDSTPNIFSVFRVAFILTPAALPVIGPVISLILAFVDKMIAMKINDDQSKKLINAIEKEIEITNNKMDKVENTEKLEKYKEALEKSLKKVKSYRDTITDDIEFDEDDDKSDDIDMDMELDESAPINDKELLNTCIIAESVSKIIEYKDEVSNLLCNIIRESNLSYEDYKNIIGIVSECKFINKKQIYNEITSKRSKTPVVTTESLVLNSSINNDIRNIDTLLESKNSTSSLYKEAYILESLLVLNEKAGITSKLKLVLLNAKEKSKELSTKEKKFWKDVDVSASGFMRAVEKALTSDRREAIIKGSIIPSFSKCIKFGLVTGALYVVNPTLGVIAAMGSLGVSKALNYKERQLIYDEIETELKVVEKHIEMANNDGDMKKYKFYLQYQKKLEREKQRIRYGLKVKGRDIPSSKLGNRDDD